MSSIKTSGQGFIATGAETGQIRLYDKIGLRAKTLLPGLGDAIKHLDVTFDGKFLLATCKDYLMLVPTEKSGTEQLGFQVKKKQTTHMFLVLCVAKI